MGVRKTKRCRLSEKIVHAFKEQHDMDVFDVRLYPAKGAYRTQQKFDVYRFEGFGKWRIPGGSADGLTIRIDSWCTMTDLLRSNGIRVEPDGAPTAFEVVPIN